MSPQTHIIDIEKHISVNTVISTLTNKSGQNQLAINKVK